VIVNIAKAEIPYTQPVQQMIFLKLGHLLEESWKVYEVTIPRIVRRAGHC
jgi:hypothetical protein